MYNFLKQKFIKDKVPSFVLGGFETFFSVFDHYSETKTGDASIRSFVDTLLTYLNKDDFTFNITDERMKDILRNRITTAGNKYNCSEDNAHNALNYIFTSTINPCIKQAFNDYYKQYKKKYAQYIIDLVLITTYISYIALSITLICNLSIKNKFLSIKGMIGIVAFIGLTSLLNISHNIYKNIKSYQEIQQKTKSTFASLRKSESTLEIYDQLLTKAICFQIASICIPCTLLIILLSTRGAIILIDKNYSKLILALPIIVMIYSIILIAFSVFFAFLSYDQYENFTLYIPDNKIYDAIIEARKKLSKETSIPLEITAGQEEQLPQCVTIEDVTVVNNTDPTLYKKIR